MEQGETNDPRRDLLGKALEILGKPGPPSGPEKDLLLRLALEFQALMEDREAPGPPPEELPACAPDPNAPSPADTEREGLFLLSPDHTFMTVAPELASLMGYPSPLDLVNTVSDPGAHFFADPESLAEMERIVRGAGYVSGFEAKMVRADGQTFFGSITATAMRDGNGELLGYEGRLFDVTKKKELEKAQREREVAELANKAKSDFLATMTHELRTPMNAIIGMTDITLETGLTPRQRDYLETVREAGRHLLTIINDILDFAKIEARQLSLESLDFDLHTLLRHTIKALAPMAAEKNLELGLEIAPGVDQAVAGDPGRLRQVLNNLLGNAIKFTESGSVLLVAEPAAEPAPGDPERPVFLSFSVEDTGTGVPKDMREAIFNRFQQGDGSISRKHGGSGLGLAIARELVGLMGGEIGVRSREGRGSRFTFTARFGTGDIQKARPPEKPAGPPPEKARPLRILVVEDSAVNAQVAEIHLTGLGHQVSIAESAKRGLELLAQRKFDLVLMDVEMPEMDGVEATRRVREGDAAPDIPIVAMTAHTSAAMRKRCQEAGMNGYISKPFLVDDLVRAINELLPGRGGELKRPRSAARLSGTPGHPIWDRDAALEKFGGDESILNELLPLSLEEAAEHMDQIANGILKGDFESAARSAHTLKNTFATVGALEAREHAIRTEAMARARDGRGSREALDALRQAVVRFREVLASS